MRAMHKWREKPGSAFPIAIYSQLAIHDPMMEIIDINRICGTRALRALRLCRKHPNFSVPKGFLCG
jgi:hypothetical protein